MKFRTEYETQKAPFMLEPDKPVVLFGSCFSQNMARKMTEHGWNAVLPGSTLYNPVSIAKAIALLCNTKDGSSEFISSLFEHNGIWNSPFFDSSFSGLTKENCLKKFLGRQEDFLKAMSLGAPLIVTYGTAICYHQQSDGLIVGNCHKLPADRFYRNRLTIKEIVEIGHGMIQCLREIYNGLKVVITVSPVRHLKDGFEGNMLSKATLLLAVEQLCKDMDSVFYFPAYEILNDDLRDYRFYASDLCHPSDQAIDYIWGKFCDTFISSTSFELLKEGNRRYRASLHRPLISG